MTSSSIKREVQVALRDEAEGIAGGIALKLADWREIALSKEVGLKEKDLKTLEPAFEHSEAFAARSLAR